MRIAIETLGTRGDMQPYIALALGLMERGHGVQLAGPTQFEAMALERGVPFAPLPGEFLALLDTPEGKAAMAGGQGFSAGLKLLKHIRPLMARLMDEEWAAVKAFSPELIVYHPKSLATPYMARALKCPAVLASPLPGFTPTSDFPSPMLPFASLGPLNHVSHALGTKAGELLFGKDLRKWQERSLGLSNAKRPGGPSGTVYAYSPQVVPVPRDWGPDVLVSGYWFLDSPDWQIPDSLSAFLNEGEPPVYVGFGSVPGLDPEGMAGMVIEALSKTGKRGVMATGGGALASGVATRNVHIIAGAPHDKLFPLVSAAIHHGGAGTTGAALRAGLPTAICPFFGDQPFWGRRVAELGVGPAPLDRETLSSESLANAIAAMDDPNMRVRAAALGEKIRREDGVGAAVRFIESRGLAEQQLVRPLA